MIGWVRFVLGFAALDKRKHCLAVPFVIFEFSLPFSVKAGILPCQPAPKTQANKRRR